MGMLSKILKVALRGIAFFFTVYFLSGILVSVVVGAVGGRNFLLLLAIPALLATLIYLRSNHSETGP